MPSKTTDNINGARSTSFSNASNPNKTPCQTRMLEKDLLRAYGHNPEKRTINGNLDGVPLLITQNGKPTTNSQSVMKKEIFKKNNLIKENMGFIDSIKNVLGAVNALRGKPPFPISYFKNDTGAKSKKK
jgi:hypothetical protein